MNNVGLDGKDVGADVPAVLAAIAGVDTGTGTTLSITTPTAVRTIAYSKTLAAKGGTAPYTWAIMSGTQPSGLSLSSAGVLSGTPSSAATFTFTARVTDNVAAPAGPAPFRSFTRAIAVMPDYRSCLSLT